MAPTTPQGTVTYIMVEENLKQLNQIGKSSLCMLLVDNDDLSLGMTYN
jgi:hypothetical protein